jgi:membrane-associated phospholipid phosphatase
VGLVLARDVARAGYEVVVVEEHQEIGYPVKCSGLYSIRGLREIDVKPPEDVIRSVIRGGRFYSPSGRELFAYSRMDRAYVVEKRFFDRFLAMEAADAGARILLKTVAEEVSVEEDGVRVRVRGIDGEETLRSQILAAADGVRSRIARRLGFRTPTSLAKTRPTGPPPTTRRSAGMFNCSFPEFKKVEGGWMTLVEAQLPIVDLLNPNEPGPLDSLVLGLTLLGSWKVLAPLSAGIALGRRELGARLLLALLLTAAVVTPAKAFFGVDRPFEASDAIRVVGEAPSSKAFPSGHAAFAFAFFSLLSRAYGRAPLFYTLALAVALSRIYLGVHYPLDVAAGAIVGLLTARVAERVLA